MQRVIVWDLIVLFSVIKYKEMVERVRMILRVILLMQE